MKSSLPTESVYMKIFYAIVFFATLNSLGFSRPLSVPPIPALSGSNVASTKVSTTPASDWDSIRSVIQDPRCMNCHTVTEFPRQGDQRHRHQQLIIRGEKDKGAPSLACSACHQSANSADGQVPGAPQWHLAPLSMGWENLNSAQLCEAIKDKTKNGGRNLSALESHMTSDPLVQWAWLPGARRAPLLDQKSFHETVKRWVAAGAACPQ
jgi:hypothetical protein